MITPVIVGIGFRILTENGVLLGISAAIAADVPPAEVDWLATIAS